MIKLPTMQQLGFLLIGAFIVSCSEQEPLPLGHIIVTLSLRKAVKVKASPDSTLKRSDLLTECNLRCLEVSHYILISTSPDR